VSQPVVSRDGTRIAFARIECVDSVFREGLYVIRPDGDDLRLVFSLRPDLPRTTRPTSKFLYYYSPPKVAWSHDSSALLIQQDTAPRPDEPRRLVLLDMQSGTTRVLISFRARPGLEWYPVITSQAWAPDGRRFVYTNDEGRVTILDTGSGDEVDLGPGLYPTWSPDGRAIAVKNSPSRDKASRDMGDYFVVAAEPPHDRTLLRQNRRPSGWDGPALWSPDGRHVLIWRTELAWYLLDDFERPYVQDVVTGRIGRAPRELSNYSWGGRP